MAEDNTTLALREQQRSAALAPPSRHLEMMQRYDILSKFADRYAKSAVIPAHFQGKPDDVFVVLDWADRHAIDYREALEQAYVIHGKMGLSAKMLIALVNNSGLFRGPLRWELSGAGDGRTATCIGVDRETNRELRASCSYKMAKDEGWTRNKKWESMTDLMLTYRSGAFFQRMYCPQVTMMLSSEEIVDIGEDASSPTIVTGMRDVGNDEPAAQTQAQPEQPGETPHLTKWKEYAIKVGVSLDELSLLNGRKPVAEWTEDDNAKVREEIKSCYESNKFHREHFDATIAPEITKLREDIESAGSKLKLPDYTALLKKHGIDGSKGLETCKDVTALIAVHAEATGKPKEATVPPSDGGDGIPF